MTNQEAFDNAYRHHVLEGEPAGYDKHVGHCVYYDATTGAECAIGCQPIDSKLLEGVTVDIRTIATVAFNDSMTLLAAKGYRVTRDKAKAVMADLEGCNLEFLVDLQGAHDDASEDCEDEGFLDAVKIRYENLTKKWNLTIPTTQEPT